MQSDKPKSVYVQQKSGQIEVKNKPGFQSHAAYDFNSLIFKESDGDGSSIALTVGDSFNNCGIVNDVDEWLTESNDRVSCIDFYALNEDELEEDNTVRFSEELSSSDIEGYCVIDNFGQLHKINLVTRNTKNEFQSVSEDIKTEIISNDSFTALKRPQQIITVCRSDDQLNPIIPAQNITEKPRQIESIKSDIGTDYFINSVNTINESDFKSPRINKDCELVNLNKSVSNLPTSLSNKVSPSSKKNSSVSLPVVKLPKKYILSGKIISQNMLPLLRNRNQLFIASRPTDTKKSNKVLCSNVNHKGKSLLKCNSIKTINPSEDSKLTFFDFKQSNEKCMSQKSSNKTELVDNGSSLKPRINVSTKKSNTPLAVVAISTNKSDDTTEIIIKTDKGEELYKGKTSEMMKATKNNYYTSNILVDKNFASPSKIGNISDVDDHVTLALESIGIDKNSFEQIETPSGQVIGYVCPVEGCKNIFEKIQTLNFHILSHYNIRPFKCDYKGCSWSFYSNFRLKRHKETHLKIKHFKCTYNSCDRTFTTIYNLNTHLKLHERPAFLKCTVDGCEETFQTKRTLELHLKTHGKVYAPYVCKIDGCGKCYYSANSLHSHSRTHKHTINDLRCEYCYKIFDKPCRLKAHLRVHTGVKPYKCTFKGCDWAFTTSSKLRRHEYKHTQVRKFTCNLCFKSFLRGEHLKDHSMKHYVCKSFVCPIAGCGLNFKNRSSVYAHLKKRHHTNAGSSLKPAVYDSWPVTLISTENGSISSGPTDNNCLDSIELLSEDNLISTMESLQYNNEVDIRSSSGGSSGLSFNAMNTDGLMVGLPELINNYTPQLDQDFNPALVTHVVVSEEHKDGENVDITESLSLNNGCIGSARTGLTYQETLQDRERRKSKDVRKTSQVVRKAKNVDCPGLRVASDVVLSAGLLGGSQDNLTRSLLLQDELSSGELYGGSQVQEDSSLLGSSGDCYATMLPPGILILNSPQLI